MLTAIVKECATLGAAFSVLQQLSFTDMATLARVSFNDLLVLVIVDIQVPAVPIIEDTSTYQVGEKHFGSSTLLNDLFCVIVLRS